MTNGETMPKRVVPELVELVRSLPDVDLIEFCEQRSGYMANEKGCKALYASILSNATFGQYTVETIKAKWGENFSKATNLAKLLLKIHCILEILSREKACKERVLKEWSKYAAQKNKTV